MKKYLVMAGIAFVTASALVAQATRVQSPQAGRAVRAQR